MAASLPYEMMEAGVSVRYVKALTWSTGIVLVLTLAQYSSVHLLNQRPASWVFEASLDLAPPFLFAGDLAQFMFTHGSQAPLREQLPAVAFGLLVNLIAYGLLAVLVVRLFCPESPSPDTFSAERRTR